MEFYQKGSSIYIPDKTNESTALNRTTHLAIAAHQDDIELMAYSGIAECFNKQDKWFCGVVVTDGAGSARGGSYKDYSDEMMKEVRVSEQKKAAAIGEYSAQVFLNYSSAEVKDNNNKFVTSDIERIIKETNPSVIYTHNLADKHDTHVAVSLKVIEAIRRLPVSLRPKKVFGCEVWRDLDWLIDSDKVIMDTSAMPNLAASLIGVFDSQISGGKRYDLAIAGRRTANATYGVSHKVDNINSINYAMDLTPLILDDNISPINYVIDFTNRFQDDVRVRLSKFSEV